MRATNSEIILNGEGYTTKQSFLDGIASVKVNTPFDIRYDHRDGINNYSSNLKASNDEIIGKSENYTSPMAKENGIPAVKKNAPISTIEG